MNKEQPIEAIASTDIGRWDQVFTMVKQRENALIAVFTSLVAVTLISAIALPPYSYSGKYTNDILIFLDGGYRLVSGQVPNRDFHTPLGPLAFGLPAFGLWLGGTLGGMMPLATALFTAALSLVLIYVGTSRLPVFVALAFATYLLLLVVAPLNTGDPALHVSFAMFYNRFSWAALSLLLLLALPRKPDRGSAWLDAIVAATLLLFMFYTKVSYAAFGLLFAGLLALTGPSRGAAIAALGAFAAAVAVVELPWGGTAGYLRDIRNAGEVSGAVRGALFTLPRIVLDNLAAGLMFGGVVALGWWRGVALPTLLLCLFMAVAGLFLLNQNAQQTGILTLVPSAMVVALAPASREPGREAQLLKIAAAFLITAIALPVAAASAVALGYYVVKSARAPTPGPYTASLDGLIARDGEEPFLKPRLEERRLMYRFEQSGLAAINAARHATTLQPLGQAEYLQTIHDGANLLRREPRLSGKVFVFDMANPFPALLGRPAPRGVDAWNHVGRTITRDLHRPPDLMLADVDVVMVPKAPMELGTTELLQRVYGPYVQNHYHLAGVSDYWRAYVRTPPSRPSA